LLTQMHSAPKMSEFLQIGFEVDDEELRRQSLASASSTPRATTRQARYVPMSFEFFGILPVLNVQRKSLEQFTRAMEDLYQPNPYHNWAHAFATFHLACVLLANVNQFLTTEGRGVALAPADGGALLLAALGHDAAHPGRNNAFEVATSSKLALRYNDEAVLECYHASLTCRAAMPLLGEMESTVAKRVRRVMIHTILSTDMAKHHGAVTWLSTCNLLAQGADLQGTDLELAAAMLHCADLGHPVLPWKTHRQFSLACCAEFFAQFNEEKQLGLPTLPFMGKDPHGSLREIGPLQTGFLSFVVMPLWQTFNRAVKGHMQFLVNNLANNHKNWEDISNGIEVDDDCTFFESEVDYMDKAKNIAAVRIQASWRMKYAKKEVQKRKTVVHLARTNTYASCAE